MNQIFVKTAKAESEGMKLPADLKRMLSYIDGQSTSEELAMRTPPSLREKWGELQNKLLEGGYIVISKVPIVDKKIVSTEKQVSTPAISRQETIATGCEIQKQRTSTIEASAVVIAKQPEKAAVVATPKVKLNTATPVEKMPAPEPALAQTKQAAPIVTTRVNSVSEAKAIPKPENETPAGTAQHIYDFIIPPFDTTQVNSVPEAKVIPKAENETPADAAQHIYNFIIPPFDTTQVNSVPEAKAIPKPENETPADAAQHLYNFIIPPFDTTQVNSVTQAKATPKIENEIPAVAAQRIRELEIMNESTLKLLTEAYMEIEELKNALAAKS